jgi:hypothetical protein
VTGVADRLHERHQAWFAYQAATWPEEEEMAWPQEPALK